jgi:hypothetical protein
MWIHNAKAIQQLIIQKTPIQLIDEHVNYNKTLTFHLHDGCFKSRLPHKLVNPNQWIENVSWILTYITNHMKHNCVHTIVEVNNPILSDCGRIVLHHIWKHLEMFTLVITWWI